MFCDFAFYVGATRENIDEIPTLERLEASAGMKVFMGSSTGNLLVDDEGSLDRIIARLSRRAAFHSEDEDRLIAREGVRRPGDPTSHPEWRDVEAAMISTRRLVALAEKHRRRVHVLHISTGDEMAFLKDHREWASVEVTPNHLTLAAPECYERLGTFAQMNPPVRDAAHQAGEPVAVLDRGQVEHEREDRGEGQPSTRDRQTREHQPDAAVPASGARRHRLAEG